MSEFNPIPERQKQILSLLSKQGQLSVSEIVEQFSISEATGIPRETVRRKAKPNAYMVA